VKLVPMTPHGPPQYESAVMTTLVGARAGSRDALAELWRTHHASVLRYLRAKRVGSPEDVASQVWIDVARSIDRFEGDADDFRRWLFTIAHRRSVDDVRRAVRRVADLQVEPFPSDGADVEHERYGALERAIVLVSQLPDKLAEAVMLRVVNDLSIADVASVMGTTEGNVRVLVHRGVMRLRRMMDVTDDARSTMKRVS
jgi:RNA polymerase sigma-70 factor (ECF subfamily)